MTHHSELANTDALNEKIAALWDATFEQNDVLAPLFFDNIKKQQLVFIGMNPSFSDKEFKNFLKDSEYATLAQHDFFKWSNVREDKSAAAATIAVDRYAVLNHPYFAKMRKIATDNELAWQHFDMFFYRQTNQAQFQKLIIGKNGLTDFGSKQIELFTAALQLAEPKCIVVVNAKASELFRLHFADTIRWDDAHGHHRVSIAGESVPILFSSMLTGQRALDRWSFERLCWHVRYIVSNYNLGN